MSNPRKKDSSSRSVHNDRRSSQAYRLRSNLETVLYTAVLILFATVVAWSAQSVRGSAGASSLPDGSGSGIVSNSVSSPSQMNSETVLSSSPSSYSSSIDSSASSPPTQLSSQPFVDVEGNWKLRLINSENLLPADFLPVLADVGNGQKMDTRVVTAFRAMQRAAKDDGFTIWAASGYRSYTQQENLFSKRVARVQRENPSMAESEAIAEAARHVVPAGTSEHPSGLAVDINTTEVSFGQTATGRWLREHSADFGFILRYDEGKEHITKVTYEPWHFRYVGKEAAQAIKQSGQCLEEYLGRS